MYFHPVTDCDMFKIPTVLQIRTEDMDLIAERGIAAHYSGRRVASGPVGLGISSGRNAKGKVICLHNTDFALRVLYFI
jgi:GTP pyrophosphokinase